jgi:hypothetical protein
MIMGVQNEKDSRIMNKTIDGQNYIPYSLHRIRFAQTTTCSQVWSRFRFLLGEEPPS